MHTKSRLFKICSILVISAFTLNNIAYTAQIESQTLRAPASHVVLTQEIVAGLKASKPASIDGLAKPSLAGEISITPAKELPIPKSNYAGIRYDRYAGKIYLMTFVDIRILDPESGEYRLLKKAPSGPMAVGRDNLYVLDNGSKRLLKCNKEDGGVIKWPSRQRTEDECVASHIELFKNYVLAYDFKRVKDGPYGTEEYANLLYVLDATTGRLIQTITELDRFGQLSTMKVHNGTLYFVTISGRATRGEIACYNISEKRNCRGIELSDYRSIAWKLRHPFPAGLAISGQKLFYSSLGLHIYDVTPRKGLAKKLDSNVTSEPIGFLSNDRFEVFGGKLYELLNPNKVRIYNIASAKSSSSGSKQIGMTESVTINGINVLVDRDIVGKLPKRVRREIARFESALLDIGPAANLTADMIKARLSEIGFKYVKVDTLTDISKLTWDSLQVYVDIPTSSDIDFSFYKDGRLRYVVSVEFKGRLSRETYQYAILLAPGNVDAGTVTPMSAKFSFINHAAIKDQSASEVEVLLRQYAQSSSMGLSFTQQTQIAKELAQQYGGRLSIGNKSFSLDLSGTKIADLSALEGLDRLRKLNLVDTKITLAQILNFAKRHPKLTIEYGRGKYSTVDRDGSRLTSAKSSSAGGLSEYAKFREIGDIHGVKNISPKVKNQLDSLLQKLKGIDGINQRIKFIKEAVKDKHFMQYIYRVELDRIVSVIGPFSFKDWAEDSRLCLLLTQEDDGINKIVAMDIKYAEPRYYLIDEVMQPASFNKLVCPVEMLWGPDAKIAALWSNALSRLGETKSSSGPAKRPDSSSRPISISPNQQHILDKAILTAA